MVHISSPRLESPGEELGVQMRLLLRGGRAQKAAGVQNTASSLVSAHRSKMQLKPPNGSETVIQRVYQSCRWPGPCANLVRTLIRPTYKMSYRTVTTLEWRCCPGFTGSNCEEANIVQGSPPVPLLPPSHPRKFLSEVVEEGVRYAKLLHLYPTPVCSLMDH
ncbi:Collagen alpha-1(XXVI) chain isoform X6 [Aix galericulata]|nr:Collagen alpha-1(XXVI) chain isoform X6 [Aix galericulata]